MRGVFTRHHGARSTQGERGQGERRLHLTHGAVGARSTQGERGQGKRRLHLTPRSTVNTGGERAGREPSSPDAAATYGARSMMERERTG